MATFLLSGLWHGANWTFVLWGMLHAIALIYEMLTKKIRKKISKKMPNFLYQKLSMVLTFIVLCFIWIFFRAQTIGDALLIVKHIFTLYHNVPFKMVVRNTINSSEFGISSIIISVSMIVFMMLSEFRMKVDLFNLNYVPVADILYCTFVLYLIIILGVFHNSSFIYFQF